MYLGRRLSPLQYTPQSVLIRSGEAQQLTFYNTPKQTLTIRKLVTNTDKPLAGVTFLVTDANGAPVGGEQGKYTTDANGEIKITGLTPGMTLTVREIRTVKGYVLNGAPRTIQIQAGGANTAALSSSNGGNSLTFYDDPLSTLVIHKYVSGTSNEPLSGVEFKVTDGAGKEIGESGGVFYTDSAGDITIPNLEPGTTLKVRETKTVDGYILDGTPQTIRIQSSDAHELTFWNAPKQSLTIQKYEKGSANPIQGAKFLVTDDDGKPLGGSDGEFTTDENGRILIDNLTPGATITAKEIEAAEGFVLDGTPKSIKIKSGAAQTLTFYNTPTQNLIIQKYVTDSTTPIQGVTFHVTDADGKTLGNSNGDFVTDANGQIIITDLVPGDTLTVKETKTVSGYVLDSTPQDVFCQGVVFLFFMLIIPTEMI